MRIKGGHRIKRSFLWSPKTCGFRELFNRDKETRWLEWATYEQFWGGLYLGWIDLYWRDDLEGD